MQMLFRNHGAVGIGRDDFILKKVYFRGFHDPLDEQQAGQHQSELNGHGQVEYHGEEESDEQDGHIGLRIAQKFPERPPTAHVIAHDDQHARQTGHRNVLRQWHEQQENEQQHDGMHDSGHGGASPVIDIRHGTGDGTGGRDTAEDGGEDVGDALSHQFLIRVVMVADDTVGHGGREQRFDGPQYGDGDGRSHQLFDAFPIQFGYVHARKFGFNHKAVADGFHLRRYAVLFQQIDSHGHYDDGNERTRNLVGQFGREGDNGHADYTHDGGPYVQAAEVADVHDPFFYKIGRHVVDG